MKLNGGRSTVAQFCRKTKPHKVIEMVTNLQMLTSVEWKVNQSYEHENREDYGSQPQEGYRHEGDLPKPEEWSHNVLQYLCSSNSLVLLSKEYFKFSDSTVSRSNVALNFISKSSASALPSGNVKST